jgi:hypothetical protein
METTTTLNSSLKNQITTTIVWARYAAIISLINLGLSLLQLIVGFIKGNPFILVTVLFFIISTSIGLVLSINLLRYSSYAKAGIQAENSTAFYQSLYHLKIYFLVMGVLFLIAITLLILIFIFWIISIIISAAN